MGVRGANGRAGAKACLREEGRVPGIAGNRASRQDVGTRARLREDKLHQPLRGKCESNGVESRNAGPAGSCKNVESHASPSSFSSFQTSNFKLPRAAASIERKEKLVVIRCLVLTAFDVVGLDWTPPLEQCAEHGKNGNCYQEPLRHVSPTLSSPRYAMRMICCSALISILRRVS